MRGRGTQPLDFEQVCDSVDLFELAARYTTLNRGGNGPCPVCGGTDRFYVNRGGRTFGCRKCGFAGDAIDMVSTMERVSLLEAARMLAGVLPDRIEPPKRPEKVPDAGRGQWKDKAWQLEASRELERCQATLRSEDGVKGRMYLEDRGLGYGTCLKYGIGFHPEKFDPIGQAKRPAVVVPWYAPDGRITALKFRFIDKLAGEDKKRRFIQKGGSDPIMFGLQHTTGEGIMVGVEGEFNALAIRQALPEFGFDVTSYGSEANSLGLRTLVKLSRKHSALVVWMDDAAKIEAAQAILPAGAIAITTPSMGYRSKPVDANDLLRHPFIKQAGLAAYLLQKLEDAAEPYDDEDGNV